MELWGILKEWEKISDQISEWSKRDTQTRLTSQGDSGFSATH